MFLDTYVPFLKVCHTCEIASKYFDVPKELEHLKMAQYSYEWSLANCETQKGMALYYAGHKMKALECYEAAYKLYPKDEVMSINMLFRCSTLEDVSTGKEICQSFKGSKIFLEMIQNNREDLKFFYTFPDFPYGWL